MAEKPEPVPTTITPTYARAVANSFDTPVFVYSQSALEQQADKALSFPNEYGLTVRYAMKANPNANILRIFHNKGIQIDASSEYEAIRAMKADIPGHHILLTSQQFPSDIASLVRLGVEYNACSLKQLQLYGQTFPTTQVSIRVNPGLGSGGTNRTNTGGPSSSFGIWHEQLEEALKIAKEYRLGIKRVHTHIGSGSNPEMWQKIALMSLGIVERVMKARRDVKTLNLGGGYKVGRMSYEKTIDMQEIGKPVRQAFINFAKKTGRELHLEIEPGTFLVANAGCLVSRVIDIKSTSDYNFIIVDAGMTEITRPALYGAQHPISVVPANETKERGLEKYIVSGHCCESGDILTPEEANPEALKPRLLLEAKPGDLIVIGGAGAYCSAMSTKNYNSFPEAAEALISRAGKTHLIRKRQTLEQLTQNEILLIPLVSPQH